MSACPFADQRYRYDSRYPSSGYSGGPSKGVLHTTEGSLAGALQAYGSGAKAPHFTVDPVVAAQRVDIFQHFDTGRPSRALANAAGGVQTNGDGAVQIELVGTCYDGGPGMVWPRAPRWALDGLARLMRWIEADRGIPRVAASIWLPYPSSYGSTSARMSQQQWDGFAGWCGHQHVPENTHGDPGQLDMAYLLGSEDDMFEAQDRQWLADIRTGTAGANAKLDTVLGLLRADAQANTRLEAAIAAASAKVGVQASAADIARELLAQLSTNG